MPEFSQLVSAFREQMSATLARSDVLKPLSALIGISGLATVLMVTVKGPDWLVACMGAAFLIGVALYSFAYIWCLFKDRDALRSEKYSLNKMAIEHGLLGDSLVGTFEAPILNSTDGSRSAGPAQIEQKK